MLENALAAQGEGPIHPIMELGSTEAIKRVVAAGLGVSFVSEHTIEMEIASGRLRQVSFRDFAVQRPLSIVCIKGKRLSMAAQSFLNLIEATA